MLWLVLRLLNKDNNKIKATNVAKSNQFRIFDIRLYDSIRKKLPFPEIRQMLWSINIITYDRNFFEVDRKALAKFFEKPRQSNINMFFASFFPDISNSTAL